MRRQQVHASQAGWCQAAGLRLDHQGILFHVQILDPLSRRDRQYPTPNVRIAMSDIGATAPILQSPSY
jgi:hypothetical protein